MDTNQTGDILRVQGVLSRGFGLSPKLVTKDRRLSLEAKGIYAYLASYAGSDFEKVFPSRRMILEDLGISSNRYYKYLKQLFEYNYISVEKTTTKGNRFGRNIYTLIMMPDPAEEKSEQELNNSNVHVKRPRIVKRLDRKKDYSEIDIPAVQEQLDINIQKAKDQNRPKSKTSASGERNLAEQLEIEKLIQKMPESKKLIQSIVMVIEDMSMLEQITINGSVKKKAAIRQLLEKLRPEHIEVLVNNISESGQKIRNKKAYIQSCIGNVLFDVTEPLDFSKKPVKQEKEKMEEAETMKRKEEYAKCPELKQLDHQIKEVWIKLSKALLSGNERQHKALLIERERLEEQREKVACSLNATS